MTTASIGAAVTMIFSALAAVGMWICTFRGVRVAHGLSLAAGARRMLVDAINGPELCPQGNGEHLRDVFRIRRDVNRWLWIAHLECAPPSAARVDHKEHNLATLVAFDHDMAT
jgi:hypothetical protein